MRVAVVGGSGFLGSHVVDACTKAGHDALIVDERPPRWHPTQLYQQADVREPDRLAFALEGSQVVIHLAAVSNTQTAVIDPVLCTEINCLGTVNVLHAARMVGVERVFIGSSSLLSALQIPFKMGWPEAQRDLPVEVVNEASLINPLASYHPYLSSKLFAEMVSRDYAIQHRVPTTVFRYGIMYGERMTPGVVVHTFIERALSGKPLLVHGNGLQWRQYLHVSDVARAHVDAIEHWDQTEDGTYNLVPHEVVTISDIAEQVSEAVGGVEIQYAPRRGGDIDVQFCLNEQARRDFGWQPRIGLKEGIERTTEWYRKHLASGVRRR